MLREVGFLVLAVFVDHMARNAVQGSVHHVSDGRSLIESAFLGISSEANFSESRFRKKVNDSDVFVRVLDDVLRDRLQAWFTRTIYL